MTEKQFENKIKKFLKSHNIWFTKIWGGGFQKAGIPDILACVNGRFVAIEIKGSSGKPTELQKYNIKKINESNIEDFVGLKSKEITPEEAVEFEETKQRVSDLEMAMAAILGGE